MATQNAKDVSAQVVLKPAGPVDPNEAVTAENVRSHMPAEDDLRSAAGHFKELGFRVEHAFGNSFSITGPASLFEKVFHTKLSEGKDKALKAVGKDKSKSSELSTESLSEKVRDVVAAVTFSEPPDFGPGNF